MAANNILKDALATHSFTNYLLASYQGKFAELSVLSQLKHKEFNGAELTLTKRALERIDGWTQDLWKGLCLFSATWVQVETFEAQDAIELLAKLKTGLQLLSHNLKREVTVEKLAGDPEYVSYLLAAFARFAYSRDAYLNGLVSFEQVFHPPEPAKQVDELRSIAFPADYVASQTPDKAARDTSELSPLVQQFMNMWLNRAEITDTFYTTLLENTRFIPYIFKAHCHDINQLLSRYRGGLTYATAEFSQKEMQAWSASGFGPLEAGYWRAYEFEPTDGALWGEIGVRNPAAAREWTRFGFDQHGAAGWLAQGIHPELASLWHNSGFNPGEARAWLERGILDPNQVIKPA